MTLEVTNLTTGTQMRYTELTEAMADYTGLVTGTMAVIENGREEVLFQK